MTLYGLMRRTSTVCGRGRSTVQNGLRLYERACVHACIRVARIYDDRRDKHTKPQTRVTTGYAAIVQGRCLVLSHPRRFPRVLSFYRPTAERTPSETRAPFRLQTFLMGANGRRVLNSSRAFRNGVRSTVTTYGPQGAHERAPICIHFSIHRTQNAWCRRTEEELCARARACVRA